MKQQISLRNARRVRTVLMAIAVLALAGQAPAAAEDSVFVTIGAGNNGRVIDPYERTATDVYGTVDATASQRRLGTQGSQRPVLTLDQMEPKKIRFGSVDRTASEQRQLPWIPYSSGKPYRYAAEMAAPVTVFITIKHRGQRGLADAIGSTRAVTPTE